MFKFKRVAAFVLDAIFVSLLTVLIVNSPLLSTNADEVKRYSEAYKEKAANINVEEISKQDNPVEYMYNEMGVLLYDTARVQVYVLIVFLIVNTLYFTLFAFFNQGRTLGCVFNKLKIVKRDDSKAGIFNLAIRSLFMGSYLIYQFPITAIMMIIIPRVFDARMAFYPLLSIVLVDFIIELTLFAFFLLNKKDMTIQDYLSNTKILAYKR